jgi:hypothetical protein
VQDGRSGCISKDIENINEINQVLTGFEENGRRMFDSAGEIDFPIMVVYSYLVIILMCFEVEN